MVRLYSSSGSSSTEPATRTGTDGRTAADGRENVPLDSLFMAYHMPAHCHPDYYAFDILSDVLSNGRSSRLNQRLVQQKQLFSSIDAYISGSVDAGLFLSRANPRQVFRWNRRKRPYVKNWNVCSKNLLTNRNWKK